MINEFKLKILDYQIIENSYSKFYAYKFYNQKFRQYIVIDDSKIVESGVTYYLPIATQKDIENLQIAFNRLQSDLKELAKW